ncbi:MAG: prepilin peptidase [Chloroflexota bacterium]
MWTPIFGFILGICIGSFLNVCIDRLPRGQSLIYPPSHCDTCGRKLRVFALIPIASYLWLKGRCRYCGANIPRRVFAVELGTGLLFAFVSFSYGFSIEFWVLAFYTCLFLVLAVIDLEHGLILNKIVYPAIGISLILSPFWPSLGFSRAFLGENTMLHVFLSSLSGGGIFAGLFLLIALLYKGGMGWGDLKMAGLVGLATGFPSVLVAMMISFLSGGLTAGFLLLLRRKRRKEAVPYAPFLSLGALVGLLWGEGLTVWYLGL